MCCIGAQMTSGGIIWYLEKATSGHVSNLGFLRYHEVDDMCGWCLGNLSTLPQTCCRSNAGWRATSNISNDIVTARLRDGRITHATVCLFTMGNSAGLTDFMSGIIMRTLIFLLEGWDLRPISERVQLICFWMSWKTAILFQPGCRIYEMAILLLTLVGVFHMAYLKTANSRHFHVYVKQLATRFCDNKVPVWMGYKNLCILPVCL